MRRETEQDRGLKKQTRRHEMTQEKEHGGKGRGPRMSTVAPLRTPLVAPARTGMEQRSSSKMALSLSFSGCVSEGTDLPALTICHRRSLGSPLHRLWDFLSPLPSSCARPFPSPAPALTLSSSPLCLCLPLACALPLPLPLRACPWPYCRVVASRPCSAVTVAASLLCLPWILLASMAPLRPPRVAVRPCRLLLPSSFSRLFSASRCVPDFLLASYHAYRRDSFNCDAIVFGDV